MITAALALFKIAGGWIAGILRSIPPWAWLVLGLLVAAFLYGNAREAQGYAEAKAEYEAQAIVDSEQAARFLAEETARNRIREQNLGNQLHQAAIDHAKELKDLEARTGRTVADLRAGNVQLRQHWRACLGKVPGPGNTPETGPADDAAADLRAADIGRVQGIAGSCDAAVKRWQDTWKAAERAVNSGG